VLFDTTRFEKLLTYDTLKRLITTQLRDADIIALSKADRVSKDDLTSAFESVRHINPKAEIITLSTRTGAGIPRLLEVVRDMKVPA
jgi:G3E family GTPase